MLDNIVIEKSLSERQEQKNQIINWLMSYKNNKLTPDTPASDIGLTYTENQVCELIKIGFSTKEIAEKLNVSIDTVHTHRKNIRKKLGLSDKNINLYSYIKSNF
ncbi:MAG: helix-turn-helix transcriptional regulator, partial [Deferribacterales bacterium]|nr:helix-turn-helix transcriptional regulator [Deferribacterales bacterium]